MRNTIYKCRPLGLLFTMLSAAYASAAPLTIYTVNYPLQYFAQRIAGENADVVFPAPADVDPAYWRPAAEQVIAYQRADLILLNGAGYARWVNTVTLPQRRLVDTSKAFKDDYITITGVVSHSHGPERRHAHGDTAMTTWLDFQQAIAQAEVIQQALIKADPKRRAFFAQNFRNLQRDLADLDRRMLAVSHQLVGAPIVFSHPVYQYLERRYRLNGRSLHWEPNEAVGADQWQMLSELLKQHRTRWMVWEGVPLPATAKRLNEMGIEVIVFDTAANRVKKDFMTVMRENVQAFERMTEQ